MTNPAVSCTYIYWMHSSRSHSIIHIGRQSIGSEIPHLNCSRAFGLRVLVAAAGKVQATKFSSQSSRELLALESWWQVLSCSSCNLSDSHVTVGKPGMSIGINFARNVVRSENKTRNVNSKQWVKFHVRIWPLTPDTIAYFVGRIQS